jgi:hypothetical protein
MSAATADSEYKSFASAMLTVYLVRTVYAKEYNQDNEDGYEVHHLVGRKGFEPLLVRF